MKNATLFASETRRPPRRLPAALRHAGMVLLDQQMWYWGQDIRRPEGNALVRYGFTRWQPSAQWPSSSAYVLAPGPGRQVVLWGFGFFYGEASGGGVYLARFDFDPVWTSQFDLSAALWSPEQPPKFRARRIPTSSTAWAVYSPALEWIADYEQWALETLGLDYRRRCAAGWHKKVIPPEEVPAVWRRLAEQCRALYAGIPS